MSGSLDGKVAVITGAASGMGRQMALRFTSAGAKAIVIADISERPREGGPSTAEEVRRLGGTAFFVKTDVTRSDDTQAAVAAAEQFGGVDIMVNNAGIYDAQPIECVSEDDFDRFMSVNVKGPYFGAKHAAASMKAGRRGGVIINIGSIAGIVGSTGLTLYDTTKGAVRLFTYSLADELGPQGIRVVGIAPGVIETTMTLKDVPSGEGALAKIPLGRFGVPTDVANVAVWLAGNSAAYVHGTMVVVDGGRSRVM